MDEGAGVGLDAMTCLAFILLKAWGVWSTPFDWPVALGLLGLDVIGVAEWTRIRLHLRGR